MMGLPAGTRVWLAVGRSEKALTGLPRRSRSEWRRIRFAALCSSFAAGAVI